jgi:hypothetical protein
VDKRAARAADFVQPFGNIEHLVPLRIALGEFEQGRPVLELLFIMRRRQLYPGKPMCYYFFLALGI